MINSNSILQIDTNNLQKNYKSLSKHSNKVITGATIKANAYGTGAKKIFKILYTLGCRHFFFATLEEAIEIRKYYLNGNLYVLNGLENNSLKIFVKYNLIPIFNSNNELNKFYISQYYKKKIKIGVHIDTGLNRLGINIENLNKNLSKKIDLHILISHLASADEINNKYNLIQNNKFIESFKLFKKIKYKSLSNSSGIINSNKLHHNLIRPGIALYGGYNNHFIKKKLKIKPVVKLLAKILQTKTIKKNEYIGYNQTFKSKKTIKIAVLGIGYADGVSRLLSNNGKVYYKEDAFNIIGRVSMDSITIDISKSKYIIKVGSYMEIINENYDIEKLARKCNTISNEILTSISNRVKRKYI